MVSQSLMKINLRNNKVYLRSILLFLRIFGNFINKICISSFVGSNYSFSDYSIEIPFDYFLVLIKIMKSSLLLNYNYFIDMTCVDLLNLKTTSKRFKLNYILQNSYTLSRLFLCTNLNKYENVSSVNGLYYGSIWAEREVYDLFGVYFTSNFDLRRILTDYGFFGFPLQKDFPLTGYLELRYCEELKCIKYSKVKLMQEYRNFTFVTPWDHFYKMFLNSI